MSAEERARGAIAAIDQLLEELGVIVDTLNGDQDYETAGHRLGRWESRAVKFLAELMGSDEVERFKENTRTNVSSYVDLVGVGNQQKWDTFVKERSGGNGGVVGLS